MPGLVLRRGALLSIDYPYVAQAAAGALDIVRYLIIFAFYLIPGIIEARGKLTGKYLRSKI